MNIAFPPRTALDERNSIPRRTKFRLTCRHRSRRTAQFMVTTSMAADHTRSNRSRARKITFVWEISDDSPNDFITQRRIVGLNITRGAMPCWNSYITLQIHMLFGTEDPYVFQKRRCARLAARRRCAEPCSVDPSNAAPLLEVSRTRMGVELLIKPGRSALWAPDTKIGLCTPLTDPFASL